MKMASETMAMFMPKEAADEDRKTFVHNLGVLLSMTRDGVKGCELMDVRTDHEYVLVTYKDGYTRKIGVAADSYAAIIRDVAKRFQ